MWAEETVYDVRFASTDREALVLALRAGLAAMESTTREVDAASTTRLRWLLGLVRDAQPTKVVVFYDP